MHKLQHTYTPNETTSRVIKIYVFYYSVSFYCAFTANEVLLSGFLLINVLFLNVIPRFLCCMRRDERRFFSHTMEQFPLNSCFFFPVSPELYVRLMLYSLRPTVTFWNIETQNIHMYLLYHFAYNLIQFGEYKYKLFSACLTFLQILQCNSYNGAAHTHIRSHTHITWQKHRIIVNIIFDLLNSIV